MRTILFCLSTAVFTAIPGSSHAWNLVMTPDDGATVYLLFPLKRANGTGGYYTASEYYSYGTPNTASANTPDGLEEENVVQFFFYESPGEGLVLFVIADAAFTADGGSAQMTMTSDLAGEGLSTLVLDDPGETYDWDDVTGTMSPDLSWSACCTDGFVIGPFPTDRLWTLHVGFTGLTGVTLVRVKAYDACEADGGSAITNVAVPSSMVTALELQLIPDSGTNLCGDGVLGCPAPEPCTALVSGDLPCVYVDEADATDCEFDPCVAGSTCLQGVCQGGAAIDCSHLDGDCTSGWCDGTGSCVADAINESGGCSDGDACTTGDTCASGVCAGSAIDCTHLDGDCTSGRCNAGSCIADPINESGGCSDNDDCTTGDVCASGLCAGTAVDCSHLDDDCNNGSCSGGSCSATPVTDGTSCSDGDACTAGDTCASGLCAGSAVDCTHLDDDCNTGSCSGGSCSATPITDGTSCSDGDTCTTGDTCASGLCAGSAVDCTHLDDTCNAGVCDADTGTCVAEPIAGACPDPEPEPTPEGTPDEGCSCGSACASPVAVLFVVAWRRRRQSSRRVELATNRSV